MRLYEIDDAILACVDQETGEIIDEAALDALEMLRDKKIEALACWMKDEAATAAAIKAERDALYERQKAAENRAERLKNYLFGYLCGEKFSSPRVSITYRRSSALEIADGAEIPLEYLKVKEPEVDKVALKKAVADGLQIPGVSIAERQNIIIK